MKQWLKDFIFIIKFRIMKKVQRIVNKKRTPNQVEVIDTHKVKVIDHKGRFLLLECVNCNNRELAVDKLEAKGIYSRIECVTKGGDSHGNQEES